MQKVKESDPCKGRCALQEEKGTVRRKNMEVETREERRKERGEGDGDAASRIPSERLRRRGRS